MNELTNQQEDFVLEQQTEHINEVNDGKKETWIHDNHSSLVNEYIEESDDFKEYCSQRWEETR